MPDTLLICDDHPLFRMGLRTALADESGIEILGEASDGQQCIEMLTAFKPDVLLLDLALPGIDGYEVLRWAQSHQPALRIIVLSMYSERAFAERARTLGAAGFIAKEDALSEIHAALAHPLEDFYASESVASADATTGSTGTPSDSTTSAQLLALSPTERRVMGLLAQSLTSREIAEQLGISFRTVQTHRANIAEKLDVHGVNRLMQIAIRYKRLFE